jgi:recombination protein RecR
MKTSDPITNLINALSRLPGIGERTASRLAFHILNQPDDLARELAEALVEVKARVGLCASCCNLTEEEYCAICRNPKRDRSKICVVETTPNLRAIENTGEYRGLYHVLHGLISPLEGVGPDDLHVAELLRRLQEGTADGARVEEVILAMSPSVDGEATALYLSRLLKPTGIKITRIASGVPIGADIEYADRMTLSRALLERRTLSGGA